MTQSDSSNSNDGFTTTVAHLAAYPTPNGRVWEIVLVADIASKMADMEIADDITVKTGNVSTVGANGLSDLALNSDT